MNNKAKVYNIIGAIIIGLGLLCWFFFVPIRYEICKKDIVVHQATVQGVLPHTYQTHSRNGTRTHYTAIINVEVLDTKTLEVLTPETVNKPLSLPSENDNIVVFEYNGHYGLTPQDTVKSPYSEKVGNLLVVVGFIGLVISNVMRKKGYYA